MKTFCRSVLLAVFFTPVVDATSAGVVVPPGVFGTIDLPLDAIYRTLPDAPLIILDDGETQLLADASLRNPTNIFRSPNPQGEYQYFDWVLQLSIFGLGDLAGYQRDISLWAQIHSDSVQDGYGFYTNIFRMDAWTDPDPDFFGEVWLYAGDYMGLPPSHVHTTLISQLFNGNWVVDSFLDLTYQIGFMGAPDGPLAGWSNNGTTGTARFEAVPEPATAWLFGAGGIGLFRFSRRRK